MSEQIFDPEYWRQRLSRKRRPLHHAVYECSTEKWLAVEAKHAEVLKSVGGRVLDAGCGYGRLSEMLPNATEYVGIDAAPCFTAKAKQLYPHSMFLTADLRSLPLLTRSFDWAVCVSVRGMVVREAGQKAWDAMQKELLRVAERALILEYDEGSDGEVLVP